MGLANRIGALTIAGRRGGSAGAIISLIAPSVTVINISNTQIDFNLTITSLNQDGHKLYISTDGVNYSLKTTITGIATIASATGLTAGVLYYFYVVAYSGSDESAPSVIYDTRFKFTVDTTKTGSASDTFVLPCTGAGYSCFIDWGDGGAEENKVGTLGNVTHIYASAGTYQIKIRGTFTRIYFNGAGDKAKMLSIDSWGNISWGSMFSSFNGCLNLVSNCIDNPNTGAVTTFAKMFQNVYLFNSSMANWNITAVTTMDNMLLGNTAFTIANYDATLIGWASQDVRNSVLFNAGNATYTETGSSGVARDHLVTTHLWTITDLGPSFDNGKLVIAFDDGEDDIYNYVYPIALAEGIKCTFFITTDWVGTPGYVTWAQLQTMAANGMDLQCHTKTHPDLRTLNQAQTDIEFTNANADWVANSLPVPTHLAYPNGYVDATVITQVTPWRDSGRTAAVGYIWVNSNKYMIAGSSSWLTFNTHIDYIKLKKLASVHYGHAMSSDLDTYIAYAKSKGVDIITFSELVALMHA